MEQALQPCKPYLGMNSRFKPAFLQDFVGHAPQHILIKTTDPARGNIAINI